MITNKIGTIRGSMEILEGVRLEYIHSNNKLVYSIYITLNEYDTKYIFYEPVIQGVLLGSFKTTSNDLLKIVDKSKKIIDDEGMNHLNWNDISDAVVWPIYIDGENYIDIRISYKTMQNIITVCCIPTESDYRSTCECYFKQPGETKEVKVKRIA